ncbi:hypothetical protein CEQ24_012220 [Burkholderia glumae]|nr:hypothetical protein CEQ24_012220 [Burkholderia glumae]
MNEPAGAGVRASGAGGKTPRSRRACSDRAGRPALRKREPPGAEQPARSTRPLRAGERPVVMNEPAGAGSRATGAGGKTPRSRHACSDRARYSRANGRS